MMSTEQIKMNTGFCKKRNSGFSLIEVALAMLVIAIGIPALLGLLGSGLNMNKTSQDDTLLGTFAQAYFSAVKAEARDNWDAVASAIGTVPASQSTVFETPDDFVLRADNPVSYILKSSGPGNPEAYALRYAPSIAQDASGNRIAVGLNVWPGEYGPATSTNAVSFYTEIYRLN